VNMKRACIRIATGVVGTVFLITAHHYADANHEMKGGEPVVIENACDEECQQSWDVDTATDYPGGGTPNQFSEVPLDETGQPVTNPCPWEAAQQGICNW
jgi:hypothetical protein